MKRRAIVTAALAVVLAAGWWWWPPPAPAGLPAAISFNEHVQPILGNHCLHCHGLDSSTRKAGLRLDRAAFATAPRKDGAAVVPGRPDASTLVHRILSDDPDEVMPPPESHKTLTATEKAILRRWIADGAVYEDHWAFTVPRPADPPPVQEAAWARHPIDRFIAARLEREGLRPSPAADRRTLARRSSLDLTGLPPEPAEVEAFIADTASDAYERWVDRLLARPAYGEHRAHYWLDTVRYADTHGEHFDNYRSIWPYRDWVIRAFNDNLRFDRFITMQVAGDLQDAPGLDDLVASGFVRMHVTTAEGGAIPEEVQIRNAKDRADAIGLAFLGLSVQCAACHDHKYDPITQRDYYRLTAFFNNTTDKFSDDNRDWMPPTIAIPDEARRPAVDALLAKRAAAQRDGARRRAAAVADAMAWSAADPAAVAALRVAPERMTLHLRCDEGKGAVLANRAPGAATASYTVGATPPEWGVFDRFWPSMRLPVSSAAALPDIGDVGREDAWTWSAWVHLHSDFQNPTEDKAPGFLCGRLQKPGQPGWAVAWRKGSLEVELHDGAGGLLHVKADAVVKRRAWRHVAVVRAPGAAVPLAVHVDGVAAAMTVVKDTLKQDIRTTVPFFLGRLADGTAAPLSDTRFAEVRFWHRALTGDEVARLPYADMAAAILARPEASWNDDERWLVTTWWLRERDAEARRSAAAIEACDQELEALAGKQPRTLIVRECDTRPTAWLLGRGDYRMRSERVTPDVPAMLPRLPADAPRNRLGLARWLTAADHPLTARVTVNRLWQELFGTGLVESAEDFGVMGTRPAHRDLLDWLAVEFRTSGWDVKRLIRLMVTSATYRQAAVVTPTLAERDPANRLLARGPRFRMDAEVLRDQALASAGLLSPRIGGPSVKPYAPAGIWEGLSFTGSNTIKYQADTGEGLYRRSLYTFWKRHGPPPQLETFNAPLRDACIARRERTNTPLQALVTLNDVQFIEASRALAARAMAEGAEAEARVLAVIAGRVLTRPLTAGEEQDLLAGRAKALASYRAQPAAAQELIQVGASAPPKDCDPIQLAAWTLVASAVLNSDEALNK